MVPMPMHTPLVRKHMAESAKSRILSIYLRPWTLVRQHATPHVPHLLDLDVVVTSALLPKRRHSVKKPPSVALDRSMINAWKDYCRYHIVSKHALRLIRNFTLTQMPESIEADQEDEEETKAKTTWCEVATPWATPETIASLLGGEDIDDSVVDTQHARTSAFTRHTTHRLWGSNDEDCIEDNLSKEGEVGPYVKADTVKKHTQSLHSKRARSEDGSATLQYKGLTTATAHAWFRQLCRFGSSKDILYSMYYVLCNMYYVLCNMYYVLESSKLFL